MTETQEFEFVGYPSGDGECFCFAVDKETFVGIRGHEPDKYDEARFHKGLFAIYLNNFFPTVGDVSRNPLVKVTISVEVLDK